MEDEIYELKYPQEHILNRITFTIKLEREKEEFACTNSSNL